VCFFSIYQVFSYSSLSLFVKLCLCLSLFRRAACRQNDPQTVR